MPPPSMALRRPRPAAVEDVASTGPPSPSLMRRLWRGRPEDERSIRPVLLVLLSATALLYLVGLGASGWANPFYSAAAQAGSESWKALFFGSSDAASSITVDKPPAALWVMGASVRVFGLSSWAILAPEALMGVASVGLLYATVRRAVDPVAGLIAGAVLALTPAAALMFRFNNPDALLTLLMIGAAAATFRAVDSTRGVDGHCHATRWMALAGALIGVAFLTKMLQALLVVPGFALAFLLMSGTAYGYAKRVRDLAVAFVALVVSAGWWIAIVTWWPASSRPYIGGTRHNSILELTLGYNGLSRLTGSEPGSGWLRMLGRDVGAHVGWLLPAALFLLGAGLFIALREHLSRVTAALVIWGGWLLVTTATFSFMKGIFHAYYTVALAPSIGAVVGIGAMLLWQRRDRYPAALALAVATLLATGTSFALLSRTPDFHPWLRWLGVLGGGLVAAVLIAGPRAIPRPVRSAGVGLALFASLVGPQLYTMSAALQPQHGSIPTIGETVPRSIGALELTLPSPGVTRLLSARSGTYTWAAATIGSDNAAGYQLTTQLPVMPVGGFNGTDPTPTLARFQALVHAGAIHYFIPAAASELAPAGTASGSITRWVTRVFTATTVDGVTLYDLTGGHP